MKMKKLLSVLTAAVLGMAFTLPLSAAPISVPKPEQVQKSAVELRVSVTPGHRFH
jgi:hypothetical protein